jgi:hypothetical protein
MSELKYCRAETMTPSLKNYRDKESEMQVQVHHFSIDLFHVPVIPFKVLI